MQALGSFIFSFLFAFTGLFFSNPAFGAESSPDRQELLNRLVEGARKEGKLVVAGVGSLRADGARVYGEAFKARFGLRNLHFEYDLQGYRGQTHSRAIMEAKMGLTPTHDVMNGPDHRVVTHMETGGVEAIEHWRTLLPDGIDPKFASPAVVAGRAFLFATRVKANTYNEKIISHERMPRSTKDVGRPEYKGKFYIAPWPTAAQFGVLFYSKEEWLEIMRGWGRNKMLTLESGGGVQRMALGEFAFEPFSNAYLSVIHKAKGAPIGVHLFADFTPLSYVFHFVRKNARNPNAAKLFALWATGPEAVKIVEKYAGTGNVHIKESRVGSTVMGLAQKTGGKLISWFDSTESFKMLKWYASKEGQEYEDQFTAALGLK